MHRQRDFLLLVTLAAAAAATPVLGQAVSTASGRGTQSASIPDFSGMWGNSHLYTTMGCA
jgi:hypothetical protein